MTKEELEAMKPEEVLAHITTLNEQKTAVESKVEKLESTITEKDELIEQKTQDVIGARRKYKPLKDMTDDEKATLSDAELAAKEDQDLIYEQQEETRKIVEENTTKERESRFNKAVDKFANGDQEVAAKLKANYNLLRGSEKATTEDEIAGFVTSAVNMMGSDAPKAVQSAHNDRGGDMGAPNAEGEDFSTTEGGKQLSNMMGLQVEDAK